MIEQKKTAGRRLNSLPASMIVHHRHSAIPGIIDDLIVYRFADRYMAIVNAANLQKDFDWLQQNMIPNVDLTDLSDQISLLAIQGRTAQATLQKLIKKDLSEIKYYWFAEAEIAGVPAFISRTGYTGEDGFEVGFSKDHSKEVWSAIFEAGREFEIEPIGLGARDTLRLEVRFSLHGNDIDESTNPIEAGLGWITKWDKGDFIGKEAIAKVKAEGPARKLVGFQIEGRQIARHGYSIVKGGETIGQVTSGTFSPSLKKSIGMGYVATAHSAADTRIAIDIRGRKVEAKIVKGAFYKRSY